MMKILFRYSFLCILLFSCNREEKIPSFIEVSAFELETESGEGTNSTDISEVKVNVAGQNIGIFDFSTEIPILEEGNSNVILSAIIKQDGLENTRVPYPFYTVYSSSQNLVSENTTEIFPVIGYLEGVSFWQEGFDSSASFDNESNSEGTFERVTIADFPEVFEEPACAQVVMTEGGTQFLAETEEEFNWPLGVPVFLELNYSTNHPFYVGVKTTSGVTITRTDLVQILPTTNNETPNWRKIYINLSTVVNNNLNASNFELMFRFTKSPNVEEPLIYIDNMKVLHL